MVPLDPPYLELAFYVGPSSAQEQGILAAEAMVKAGGRFTGEIDVAQSGAVSRLSSVDLGSIKTRAEGTLRRIYLDNVTGLTNRTELIEINHGVVLFRTQGEDFSGPNRARQGRLYSLGTRAYTCFRTLALAIESYYGALCCEYSLEEPADLRRDPRSLAFRDFFVSRVQFGRGVIDSVRESVGEVYLEEFEDRGLYVSMSPEFNPDRCSVETIEAQYRSVRVAERLVEHLRFLPA